MEKREKEMKYRNLMIVDNNHRSFINNNNSLHIDNSILDKYNNYYNFSGSPMTKMIINDQRKTCYNVKPQIISNNLPSAFEFPKVSKKRKFNEEITDDKLLILKEFKNSSDLTELRKRYGNPAKFYNQLYEQLKNKLDEQIASNNSMERMMNSDKAKLKKVILKPIEIKDPRLYLPSSTNIKFDFHKNEQIITKNNEEKNKIKNKLHLEEIKESDFSPNNEHSNKYSKFAKTTYIDYQKQHELYNENESRINNNVSDMKAPIVNNTIPYNNNPGYKLKLEEMITIKVIKRSKNLGVVKKMLHAPSLRIFTIKEIPIINKEIRNQVKDMTDFWKKNLNSNNNMVKIFDIYLNTPEGYCTLVKEYMNNGSLQNLIDCTGSLPEEILKNIAYQLIKILETYQKKSRSCLGGINPSQILFNKNGIIKFCPNLKNIYYENDEYKKKYISNFNKKEKSNLKYFNIQMKDNIIKYINDDKYKFLDLFDLGFLLIQCATGCLDIIDFSEYKCEHLDEENNYSCCCLLHCIEKFENNLTTKLKIKNFINKINYSEEFTNFLCISTSYNNFQIQASKLKFHPFLKNFGDNKKINTTSMQFKNKLKKNEKYKISLKELLLISNENGGKFDYSNLRNTSSKFEKFCESMSLVLPNCESYFKDMNVKDSSQIFNKNNDIKDILQEFEVDQETFVSKLKTIFDNSFNSFSN